MPKGQKGINKMKKNIFKKIVASLATVAMAAGLFTAMPAEEAKAAENVKVYFELPSGWNAADVGVNAWGEGVSVEGDGTVDKPSHWGSGTLPKAFDNADGWVYAIIKDSSKVDGIQFVNKNSGEYKFDGGAVDGNLWNSEIEKQNVTSAYFDTTKNAWFKEAAGTTEIKPPVLDEIYAIKGTIKGTEWNTDGTTGLMTDDGSGVFSITFKGIEKGDYEYKILQDPVDFAWDNAYTKASDGNKTKDNDTIKVAETSDITISINKDTKKVTITITKAQTTNDNNNNNNNKNNNNKNNNNTPVVKNEVTVEVTLDPSLKWDEVYVHAWGDNFSTKWPGVKMTAKNGKYYATIDTKLTKLSYVISAGDGKDQTIDIADVNGQDVKITVTAKKDAEGKKFVATAAGAKGAANTGDVAPVVVMLVVAMAAASVVVASKKKTICE